MCCCLFGGNAAASLKKSVFCYLAVICQGHTALSLEMGPPSTYIVLKALVKCWDGKLLHFLKLHYLGDLIFLPVYLTWFGYMEGSDQWKKGSGTWSFHHRGLRTEMGLLHKVKYYMLLFKPLQISHLTPILIVPSQENVYCKEDKLGNREFVLPEVSFVVEDCILLIAK